MHNTLFIQSPPMLGNQYRDDTFLQSYLRRKLPAAMLARIKQGIASANDARLATAGQQAVAAIEHVLQWLSHNDYPRRLQANARRLAMTMGRALELSLLIEHAAAAEPASGRSDVATACRFAAVPPDLLTDINSEDFTRLLE